MNGRVQHPGLGRFLSPDPLLGDPANPQTLNRYAYVSNNPLALTDPSGFVVCPVDVDDCIDVCVFGCGGEQSGGQGGGVWSTTPPPPGDVGGGFTVQETPSRGDPGQAQQAGRDGSGLTRSEQEGLKNYLDAYARLRGTSGGVIFFGNRRQMGFLGETGGARALLKDRRDKTTFAESLVLARLMATPTSVDSMLAGFADVVNAIRLAFIARSNQNWVERIGQQLAVERSRYVGKSSGDAWATVNVYGYSVQAMSGNPLERDVRVIQGYDMWSRLYPHGQQPYAIAAPFPPPRPAFSVYENVQLTNGGYAVDNSWR
jgi:hypothetical protein